MMVFLSGNMKLVQIQKYLKVLQKLVFPIYTTTLAAINKLNMRVHQYTLVFLNSKHIREIL